MPPSAPPCGRCQRPSAVLPAKAAPNAKTAEMFRPSGTKYPASRLGRSDGAVMFGKDKKNQRDLFESERNFRLLVEGVTDYALYMLDPTEIGRASCRERV